MNIIATLKETYADGPGIRYAIYIAGCHHHCDGCHNPESWDFNQGEDYLEKIEDIIREIKENPMISGITFSGGDPMEHSKEIEDFTQRLKNEFPEKNIWIYTGYTAEELSKKSNFDINCLKNTDMLIDGRYDKDLKEETDFRGSSNQRFIKNPFAYIVSLPAFE